MLAKFRDKRLSQLIEEVETALTNERVLQVREERLAVVTEELTEALRIMELRYNVDEIDFLRLSQVRKQSFRARSDLLKAQVERLKQCVNLHLALGGSEARPPAGRRDTS